MFDSIFKKAVQCGHSEATQAWLDDFYTWIKVCPLANTVLEMSECREWMQPPGEVYMYPASVQYQMEPVSFKTLIDDEVK